MKKFFMFVIVVMACVINANAQLNVTSVMKDKPQKIMTLVVGYSSFNKSSNLGYYVVMNTDNRFDKPTIFILGDDEKSAKLTLLDLEKIIKEKVAFVEVEQFGDKFTLMYNDFASRPLVIKMRGNAGKSWMSLNQIEKMYNWLDNEEKTIE